MPHTENSVAVVTPPPAAQTTDSAAAAEINSMRLLGDQGLLRIAHKGAVYTLRATSKGGLILTK
ncbi:MAG: hemin uptake protein HemP [Burkholderiales bacterium]|jgi:hemin uptake protein HemP|nr:hemin uptake protein HemP [Burkholderiales bacterium]